MPNRNLFFENGVKSGITDLQSAFRFVDKRYLFKKMKFQRTLTSLQPSNAGYSGKTNWLWLLKWKRNSNIKSANARTAAASGALAASGRTVLTGNIFAYRTHVFANNFVTSKSEKSKENIS